MRFYSKKGLFTGIILWGTVTFLIGSFLFLPEGPEGKGETVTAVLICTLTSGFIMWLWFATYYEINGNELKIVAGPFRSRIDIIEIKSIRPSRSILSSPALSMNRLEILYGKWGMVLISPKNEEQFCEKLMNINPNIDIKLNDS
ncbi:PH domain-containing protein [Neobacillus kokaensis]|uniref:PH domain-containing protein n=1 Tax=Neobacillus kokaensis TaxID=2759023 RepID=UPI00174DCC2A|nr:PH domain-containing protein [Neobacillus kokaensis]